MHHHEGESSGYNATGLWWVTQDNGKHWTEMEYLFTHTLYCLSVMEDGEMRQVGKPKSGSANKVKNER